MTKNKELEKDVNKKLQNTKLLKDVRSKIKTQKRNQDVYLMGLNALSTNIQTSFDLVSKDIKNLRDDLKKEREEVESRLSNQDRSIKRLWITILIYGILSFFEIITLIYFLVKIGGK